MEQPVFELALELPPPGSRDLTRRLHRQLRDAIVEDRLKPGVRLPSTRDFAGHFGISRNTAIAVYELLLSEGFLIARQGAGTFVSELVGRAPLPKPRSADLAMRDPRLPEGTTTSGFGFCFSGQTHFAFDLRLGSPETRLFPFDVWRRLATRVIRKMEREASGYQDPAGLPTLRQAIAAHVSFARAVACRSEDVVVTGGAQQAFDLIARTLVEPGRTTVAVEEPGYPPMRAAFAAAGATIRPVPVDGEGIRVDAIPDSARIVCVTPSHQFPTGAPMSLERRNALLEFALANDAVVIEDDYDSEFRFSDRPLDALQTLDRNDSVFYVGTFSKSLFPSLRIGYAVTPAWALEAMLERKQIADWHGPDLIQRTLAEFITEGHLARHVRRMRRVYAGRRTRLLEGIHAHLGDRLVPIASHAGLHLAGRLSAGCRADEIVEKARKHDVAVECLGRYAVGKPDFEGLAFGFGCCPAERIEEAMARLASVLE